MRTAYLVLATALYGIGVMAATTSTNPLDNFISQAQSVATQLEPTTTRSSSSTSSTSSSSSSASSVSATSNTASQAASTASPSTAAAAGNGSGGGLSARDKGIIAGCVVGGFLLLAVLVILLCCCLIRRRRRRRHEKKDWEKRGLHDSDEAVHTRREVWETQHPNSPRHHGIFGATKGTPRHSNRSLPRHSGASDGLMAGTPYEYHHPPGSGGLPPHHGVGVFGAAKESPRHSSGALHRHSGASDRNLIAAAHHDHHDPRMSGGSGPLLGNEAFRHSNGSNLNDGGIIDPASPTSMNSGVKRKPVPGDHHNHHGAALGAGAVGAVAGAAAYKHHHDKHHDKRRGSGVSNGDYIEDNHRYSTESASSRAARASHEPPPPLPQQHDPSRFPPLLPPQHDPNRSQPMPEHHDAYRPPTPFGLAALGSHSPHRSPHGAPPAYPDAYPDAYHDPPFAATRRSGSFPDPSVADHHQQYPSHHTSAEPRRPSHGSTGPAVAAGAAAAAVPAALAAGHSRDNPAFHRAGSFPDPSVGDHNREYPYHHTAAPPTTAQRRSLQDREFVSANDSSEYVAYAPETGRAKRHSMPAPDTRDRSRSNSAPRVPPAAVGAVGRESPRVTATNGFGNGSGNGNGNGRHSEDLAHLSRPAYPGQQSYGSYYSDAPTPGDDIPGAFPRDRDGNDRPIGPGMREATGRRSFGNNSPARSGRKLRFSDRHEEWEFADEDRPQDAGVGRAL